jgi:hypothetical protein
MSMIVNLHFYLLRLRNASLSELVYRSGQGLTGCYLNFLNRLGRKTPDVPSIDKRVVEELKMPDLYSKKVLSLSGRDTIVELMAAVTDGGDLSRKLNSNMRGGGETSKSFDIRLMWEPARLQRAVTFLVCAHQHRKSVGCEKADQVANTLIFSWLRTNPFPRGFHYQSAMESALRVPVFFYALKRLNNLTPEQYDQILKAIYQHGWLVSKKLSLYSSLGNHTIAEAVGLVFAGAIYRSTRRGKDWLASGIRLLNDQLPHQILEDGGPLEQSLSYHRFVMDLYWIVMDFIQKNNFGNVHHWQTRLTAGEFFLGAFKDQSRLLPAIGDSDDGHAVAPGIAPFRIAGADYSKNIITFPETGYTIIRNGKLFFTFDHGSLGMAPLYNHGHADALSITLAKNGHPLLVDPGTYRYNGVPQWRRYFKGTRAHNTVTIDDQDQAVYETGFIWSKPYRAELTATQSEKNQRFFSAVHNGYTRLEDPVYHYRSILFFDEANFLIRDSFSGTGIHKFQLNYHLHPDVTLDQAGNWWVLENHGESIFLKLGNGFLKPVKGTQNPIMGWFSSRYGEKEPTTVLTCKKRGIANEVTFVTAIFTRSPFNHETWKKAEKLEREIKDS